MAYLNDSFTGGNTNFLDPHSKPPPITYALKPETGILNQYDFFDWKYCFLQEWF